MSSLNTTPTTPATPPVTPASSPTAPASAAGADAATRARLERISGLRREPRPTRLQQLQREQAEREDKVGFFRLARDAASTQWMGAWAVRQLGRRGFEVDPDFDVMDPATFKRLTADLPADMWNDFAPAVSLPHAERIREQLLDVTAKREQLADAGWTGAALNIGATVLDPAAIALSVGTGGLAGPAVYGAKLTRMQRLVRGGLVAAGSETAIEGYLATADPQRGVRDVLYAGGGGFVLGGGINVWAGRRLERAARRMRKDIEYQEVAEAAAAELTDARTTGDLQRWVRDHVLSDNGRIYFREQIDPGRQREIADDLLAKSGLDPHHDAEIIAELRQLDPAELATFIADPAPIAARGGNVTTPRPGVSAEAAVTGPLPTEFGATPRSNLQPGDLDLSSVSSARAWKTWARRSFASMLGSSDIESVRRAGTAYADDALLKADGSGGGTAASVWVRRQLNVHLSQFYRRGINEFKGWAQAHGKRPSWEFNHRDRAEFMEEVGRAIRHPRGQYTQDPHVNAMADLQRAQQRELLHVAQRHGAKGFGRVAESDTYLMRVHHQGKLNKFVERYGETELAKFYRGALLAGSDSITEEMADTVSRGFTRSILKQGDLSDLDKARMFSTDNPELLSQVLRDNVPGITDAQVEDILYAVQPRDPAAGVSPRARRRLAIDETYTATMPDGQRVTVADLLENNAETIFNLYSRQMLGTSAAAEVYRAMRRSADDVIDTFDQLANRLKRDGATDNDVELLRTLDKHVRGIPLTKDTRTGKVLRVMRGYNYLTTSGQFGLAQIPDVANVIGETGVRVMFQQVPVLRRIFSRARDGRMSDELLEEIEAWTGMGTERLTGQVVNRFDISETMTEYAGAGIDRTLRRGGRVASDVSLMTPINMMLQRYAGAATAQRLTNLAFSDGRLSRRRFQQLGLSEADADNIYRQIRRHATTEDGLLGKRLKRINIDAWDDQQAAAKLVGALDRWSRRAIQVNDIGNLHPFLTSDTGRTLFQFRTFFIAAHEKQLLHKVQMHDWQAFTAMMLGAGVAGLVYTGQEYVLSIGRRDRDEYLAERLSEEAIAKAAFQRAGWSTLLPATLDTATYASGGSPMFDARNSGLDTDFIFGNPTMSTIEGTLRATRGVGEAARGADAFSEADARAWTNLVPFRRVFGVHNMINAFQGQFPED